MNVSITTHYDLLSLNNVKRYISNCPGAAKAQVEVILRRFTRCQSLKSPPSNEPEQQVAETAGGDPFKGVHLENVGVVVGFCWSHVRSEMGNEKKK